jgi:hypothetical protein
MADQNEKIPNTTGLAEDLTNAAVRSPGPEQKLQPEGFFNDLEQFKIDLKEAGLEGAVEQLAAVQVRKPAIEDYVRVHPGKAMTLSVFLVESREGFTSTFYLVMPKMLSTLKDLRAGFYAQLYLTVNRGGSVMLWPVKLPTGGAGNPWYTSALSGAKDAKVHWIRIFADPGLGHYRVMKALGDFDEPQFPDKSLGELLEIAFNGRVIDSADHPIIRRLRGEV